MSELAGDEARLEAYEAELIRKSERFAKYLRVRGYLGVAAMVPGALLALAGLFFLALGLGLYQSSELPPWMSQTVNAVMLAFLHGAMGLLMLRTGAIWWRHRRGADGSEKGR